MARPGTFPPGVSGNPKGRPKTRVLSERLRAAGSKTIEVDGKPTAGSIVAARLAWEGIAKGKLQFPDDAEETVLSFDQWLALVKFVYGQTEGAPPVEVGGKDGGADCDQDQWQLTRLTLIIRT